MGGHLLCLLEIYIIGAQWIRDSDMETPHHSPIITGFARNKFIFPVSVCAYFIIVLVRRKYARLRTVAARVGY